MHHLKPRTTLIFGALFAFLAATVFGQSPDVVPVVMTGARPATNTDVAVRHDKSHQPAGEATSIEEVRQQLREQRAEIERLQSTLREQMGLIEELRTRVGMTPPAAPGVMAATTTPGTLLLKETLPTASDLASASTAPPLSATRASASAATQTDSTAEQLKNLEAQTKKTSEAITKQLGSITFSGDLRLRYESFYGQLNALANNDNPAILGNSLSTRQRLRLRARLALRGQIGKEFEWGLRLATGNTPDVISTNQTLTDFFSRKNFGLDHAFITYKPAAVPGLAIQGGKFDVPWLRTEMTLDNDLSVEGLNQSYTHKFKKSKLKDLTLITWQLPFLERSSAFTLGSDGKVDLAASRRNGRDLALYGGQLQANFSLTPQIALTFTAADLYFSGTQFITPAQFFGSNVVIPVTVSIPATPTTPAQTVTAQVSIPRDQLVSGNANLGVSIGTNNAVNRDGRLSSGYNLVDLIGRLDLTHHSRFPVRLLFNFVTNTQTHDVVLATGGANSPNRVLPNNENNGYWAEIQVGKTRERGDWLFGYTFMRVEKDAVLTPFNYSDFAQQSDIRAQRFTIAYAANSNVTLSLNGIVTGRPNGLLGVFGTTPPGSLNRPTTRLQFDTSFRF